MAINRVDYPANLTAQADFSAHGELIETRFMDQVNAPQWVVSGNIPQGVVLQIGAVVYRADSDTAITGTASDYVKITPSGATAAAAYVASLTSVTWSAQYNGYYDASNNLYLFDEGKALAAGQISAVFGRYVTRTQDGDVYVERNIEAGGTLDVTGNTTVGGTLSVGSTISGVKLVNGSITGTDVVHSTIFSTLSPYIPSIGDKMLINGGFSSDTASSSVSLVVFSNAERISSISIRMNGVYLIASDVATNSANVFAGTVNSGSSSIYRYLSIAW